MSILISKIFLVCLVASLVAACGGGGEGGEGGNEASEGAGHGGEGGNEGGNEGANIPFVSDGRSLGQYASPILQFDESYAGLLNDTEIAIRFDAGNRRFFARIRNEASLPVCDVNPTVELDGYYVVDTLSPGRNRFAIDGLRPYDTAEFEFQLADDVAFDEWVVMIETFGCSSAPSGTGAGGEGGEGSHNEGGGDGGNEGGGDGEGGEGGNEGSGEGGGDANEDDPTTPIADVASGTFRKAEYTFMFDMEEMVFRGTVLNPTTQSICGLKTEIHMGVGNSQVIELGPTIPFDLAAGRTVKVVMTAPAYLPDMYSVHPESVDCP